MHYVNTFLLFGAAGLGAHQAIWGQEFYAPLLGTKGTKRIPVWFGKVWFGGFGIAAISLAVKSLH